MEDGMSDLLQLAIEAHGGMARWQELKQLQLHASIDGAIWGFKGHPGILKDETIDIDTRKQWVSYTPFTAADKKSVFEPDWNAIESLSGEVIEERAHPREAFRGHDFLTPWDELHVAYFCGYAIWGYLTAPFHFAMPGVTTEEIEPWNENGDTWRGLQVSYPATMAVHCPVQKFYFGTDGLMRRLDYAVDIMNIPPSTQYMSGHREFGGIVFPTERRVYAQAEDGTPVLERVAVSIDIYDIQVS
jgi:hypothetical protein